MAISHLCMQSNIMDPFQREGKTGVWISPFRMEYGKNIKVTASLITMSTLELEGIFERLGGE